MTFLEPVIIGHGFSQSKRPDWLSKHLFYYQVFLIHLEKQPQYGITFAHGAGLSIGMDCEDDGTRDAIEDLTRNRSSGDTIDTYKVSSTAIYDADYLGNCGLLTWK